MNRILKTKGNLARCYVCGKSDEPLILVEFTEWVCAKDQERIERFFKKLKTRHTRYVSPQTWCGGHGLSEEEV